MLTKKGSTIFFEKPPVVRGYASVVGKKEAAGPLREHFDVICMDSFLGQKTFEKAEAQLQNTAVSRALKKAGINAEDVGYVMGGDLLNQCISSSYGLRDFGIPFLGLYGACSTMSESLGLAAVLCAAGAAENCAAVSSSHFCSAERQFRFPLNYGGQRTPTAQWTVTGAGSVVVSRQGEAAMPHIRAVTFGKIEDLGITDINNMGAAMAPAAASTLAAFFRDSESNPSDYDLILTGDLGKLGSDLLIRLLMDNNINIAERHNDCGKMIYDIEKQDVHSGGSGCGCSASVLCSKILRDISAGRLKKVLFMATGALMSTVSVQQGESIPGVAHLVYLSNSAEG
ncbi:MAG: stage V sporulation protein AD [Oscillospiraceae bacterium]|nr:stage V sporulation protein AD [Oscillospiraceae bacterium]